MSGPLPARPSLDSPLGRRNPTVKLALVLVASCAVLFVFDPVTPVVLYALALVAVAWSTRAPLRTLAVAHLPFLAFALGLLLVNAVSRPGAALVTLGPLEVTDGGLTVGAALAARTMLVGVLSIGFLVSTDPVALVTSLHHQARLGSRATYALLAGYRMLEEMPREWQTIRAAQQVRWPPRPPWTTRTSAWGRAAFGLLVVSIRKGERMALTLETRGVGLSPRSTWRRPRLDRADAVLAAGVVLAVGSVLAVSAALGVLEGVGALKG